jgi:hypothetical protein
MSDEQWQIVERYRQAAHEAGFHSGMVFGFCIAAIGAIVGVLLWSWGVTIAH